MGKIKVAAVQAGSLLFDITGTLEIFEDRLSAAKNMGADLAVFPEAFLGGYPKGVDFGVRVGSRQPEGRDLFTRYYKGAVERDCANMRRVLDLVCEAGINVVLGLIERDAGTLYCASATINRNGEIITWHRKLMPTAMERVIWGCGDGSTMDVASLDIGPVSTAICWENYMPLYRAHLYAQHTHIHCTPTVDDRDVWLPSLQMIALEGRCFVVSACQFMTLADVKADDYRPLQGSDPDTVLIRGGSTIISPFGDVLAAPLFDKPGIVMAEIDLDDIVRGKFDLDVSGHYARADVFSLNVNTAPQTMVRKAPKD
jgi:nitrilase